MAGRPRPESQGGSIDSDQQRSNGPRTQFVKIRWHDLQELLREGDALWYAASDDTLTALEAARGGYGRD